MSLRTKAARVALCYLLPTQAAAVSFPRATSFPDLPDGVKKSFGKALSKPVGSVLAQ